MGPLMQSEKPATRNNVQTSADLIVRRFTRWFV